MNHKYKYEEYEAIWKSSQASGNDLLLLLALVKFRQPKGMFATRETLALMIRCNVDTVDRSLKRLNALGELVWDKGSSVSKRANRYYILLPGLDFDALNTPANSPRNSPRDSSEIPPQTHEEYPRKLTPLNSNETEMKVKQEITRFDSTQFGVLHMRSCDESLLPPLLVFELMQMFESSFECRSAFTEKVRLERWWVFLKKNAEGQA